MTIHESYFQNNKHFKNIFYFFSVAIFGSKNAYSQISKEQLDTLSLIINAFNTSDIKFLNNFINPTTGVLVVDYDYVYPQPQLIKVFKKVHFISDTSDHELQEGEFVTVRFTSYETKVELASYVTYLGDGEFEKQGSFVQPSRNNNFFKYETHNPFKESDKPKVKKINLETNYLLKVMPFNTEEKFLYLYFRVNKSKIYLTAVAENQEMADEAYYIKSMKGIYTDITTDGVQKFIGEKSIRIGKDCDDCVIDFKKKNITNTFWGITKDEPFHYSQIRLGDIENVSPKIKKRVVQFVGNNNSEALNLILTNKGQLIYEGAGWQTPTVIYE